ncbi:MAG: DUF1273 family protein [Clostridia bacterium]|nr:DUF1273 family protein [Clostridia bacterium]
MQSCCFTGYRPHRFSFSPDGLRPEQVRAALGKQIELLYARGCRTFVTGMCVGVDMWAAAEVVALRRRHEDVRLVAAVPFEGQEERWPAASKAEYQRLLSACDEVQVLFECPATAEAASDCYRRRNRWMVDHTDAVLAVYDMEMADFRSGTAATVRYARRMLRPIRYIHPQTLAVADETVQQCRFEL